MKIDQAETLAIKCLEWMATRDDVLSGFLAMSGATASEIRDLAGDPAFLGFVIDHMMSQDAYMLDASAALLIQPGEIVAARAALPGGDNPNWT